ncbi:hypothetical protein [Vibrio harveyi]|uniref:hypothetical protein n=1 Tax=Vibrio harveyi TaxID=669 RepID=UPI000ADDF245|nr:hypothetical protein [Vibrio harveyi]
MNDLSAFSAYSTCAYADFLADDAHMDMAFGICGLGARDIVLSRRWPNLDSSEQ